MARTRRGFTVLQSATTQRLWLRSWFIPTVRGESLRLALRRDYNGFIIACVALWLDKHVEPARRRDTGTFNPRKIAGTATWSEHAAATALDYRWSDHPQGKRNTWNPAQRARLDDLRAAAGGALSFGKDWSTPDDMHVELAGTSAQRRRFARWLKRQDVGRTIRRANRWWA